MIRMLKDISSKTVTPFIDLRRRPCASVGPGRGRFDRGIITITIRIRIRIMKGKIAFAGKCGQRLRAKGVRLELIFVYSVRGLSGISAHTTHQSAQAYYWGDPRPKGG